MLKDGLIYFMFIKGLSPELRDVNELFLCEEYLNELLYTNCFFLSRSAEINTIVVSCYDKFYEVLNTHVTLPKIPKTSIPNGIQVK